MNQRLYAYTELRRCARVQSGQSENTVVVEFSVLLFFIPYLTLSVSQVPLSSL